MPRLTVTNTMPTPVRLLIRAANDSGGLSPADCAKLRPDSIAAVAVTTVASGKPTIYDGWSIERWDITRSDGSVETLYIAGAGNPDGAWFAVRDTLKGAKLALR
jgi:hypothetical protein